MSNLLPKLPSELLTAVKQLALSCPSAEIFLVGGAVRDLLLDRPTKDWDLMVRGVPAPDLEKTLEILGEVNLVGKSFGVFKWTPATWVGEAIDVALPRTEHVLAGTGQYRDFNIQSDPNLTVGEDLSRRDFTINALALNLSTGELIDPYGGQKDLENKILRTVGDAIERFNEDLSRTLRGVRFACQLNFTIEPSTWSEIIKSANRVASGKINNEWLVPREICARELLKSLIAAPVKALELFDDSGLLHELLPEVTAMKNCPQPPEWHSEGDVFNHTKLALAEIGSKNWQEFFGSTKPNLNAIIGILLHDIGKPLTLKTPERDGTDRIRTNEHDSVGAKLAGDICERLRLMNYVDPEHGQIEQDILVWAIQHHLLLIYGNPDIMKPYTIYKYFLKDKPRGQILQQIILADSLASHPVSGMPDASLLAKLRARLPAIEAKLEHGQLVPLLSGHDIMTMLKIPSNPRVGEIIEVLKEAQLAAQITTREEAITFITKQYGE